MNLTQLQDDVLSRLGENQDSKVAAYMASTSQTPVNTAKQTITGYLNDGQNDLARNYYPIQDSFTFTWPSGTQFVKYSSLVCVGDPANVVMGIRTLTWTGGSIRYASRAAVENWDAADLADAGGNPRWWFEDGIEGIGSSVAAPGSTAISGRALVIPKPLSGGSDTPVIVADMHNLLSYYACAMILLRKKEDPVLAARGDAFMQLYLKGAQQSLDLVTRRDPDLANDLLARNMVPTPPLAQQSGMASQ